MSVSVDIVLNKFNKIYYEKDIITGSIIVISKEEIKHEGISLIADGNVNIQLHSKGVGIFDNFYSSIKPICLFNHEIIISHPGKLPAGRNEVTFRVPLKSKENKILYETYHGYCVMIQYMIKCDIKRFLLNKDISKSTEFFIEYKNGAKAVKTPVEFVMSPVSINNKDKLRAPRFLIKGKLESTICTVTEPFTGDIIVENCDAEIRSLDLQLYRIETCGSAGSSSQEASEIQAIQFGAGDVCRGIAIPIYLLFPRLMTCPTMITTNFRVEFEIRVQVIFENGLATSENFPINLTRF